VNLYRLGVWDDDAVTAKLLFYRDQELIGFVARMFRTDADTVTAPGFGVSRLDVTG